MKIDFWIVVLLIVLLLIVVYLMEIPILTATVTGAGLDKSYKSYESDDQIQTVAKWGKYGDVARLKTLLFKHGARNIKDPHVRRDFVSKVLQLKSDQAILEAVSKNMQYDESARSDAQAELLVKQAKVTDFGKEVRYLDVGGGNGNITYAFGKAIGAVEVHCLEPNKTLSHDGIRYAYIDPAEQTIKLPYEDDYFDVITAFMSLHHIKYLAETLAEIRRVLKPGGVLYVKEHDCRNGLDGMLIDIEHRIFIVHNKEADADPHVYTFLTSDEWVKMIDMLGFKLVGQDYFYTNPRKEISITRAFVMTFRKI